MKKRLISMLLTFLLVLSAFPPAALASEEPEDTVTASNVSDEPSAPVEDMSETADRDSGRDTVSSEAPDSDNDSPDAAASDDAGWYSFSATCDPYTGRIEVLPVEPDAAASDIAADGASSSYSTPESAAAFLRACLSAHQEEASFTYSVPRSFMSSRDNKKIQDLIISILKLAEAHTGRPFEGDYIFHTLDASSYSFQSVKNTYTWSITVTCSFFYRITKEQDDTFRSRLAEVMEMMDLDGLGDYLKIRSIYNFIYCNVGYDYYHLYTPEYRPQFTAYAALVDGFAVCEGISTLFYCIALSAGVDARVITSDTHAWVIARVGDYYYNLDPTYDLESSDYCYFLLSDADLEDHPRGDDFTGDFYTEYPMSPTSYSGVQWEYNRDEEVLYVYGNGSVDCVYTDFGDARLYAKELLIIGDITEIGDHAFSKFESLEAVYFTAPCKVTSIGLSAFFGCPSLLCVSLPNSLTSMDALAFAECTALEEVYIGSGLCSCVGNPFSGCSSLSSFVISPYNGFFSEKDGCLIKENYGTSSLICGNLSRTGTYTLPSGIDILETFSLFGSQAEQIVIPSGTENIRNAIGNSERLTSVGLSATVCHITGYFPDCPKLRAFSVSSDSDYYCAKNGLLYDLQGTELIAYPPALMDSVVFVPEGTESISGSGVFSLRESLKTVILPDGLTYIGFDCFYMSSVESVYVPSSVTAVSDFLTVFATGKAITVVGEKGSWIESYVTENAAAYKEDSNTELTFTVRTPGDANVDGSLNAADLVRMSSDLAAGTGILKFADANEDGSFDLLDLVHTMKLLAT